MFKKYDSISIDYEGDHNYLIIDQLEDLLDWVDESFEQSKRLHYTIAVRSTYDILHDGKEINQYIQQILLLYGKYKNFHIILVAGNRKYVDISNQKMHMKERFHAWIQELQKTDFGKEVFIGADNIFKLTKTLLHSYDNTKAILLKNPDLEEQKDMFSSEMQSRIGVYSLLIESHEKAITYDYVKGYLQRRGIEEIYHKEKIREYAVQHEEYYSNELENNYNFMFLFSIGEFT